MLMGVYACMITIRIHNIMQERKSSKVLLNTLATSYTFIEDTYKIVNENTDAVLPIDNKVQH